MTDYERTFHAQFAEVCLCTQTRLAGAIPSAVIVAQLILTLTPAEAEYTRARVTACVDRATILTVGNCRRADRGIRPCRARVLRTRVCCHHEL
jgi:hypothetical protein